MTKPRILLLEFISHFMVFLLLYSIMIIPVFFATGSLSFVYGSFALVFVFYFSVWLGKVIKNFFLFILIHAAIIILMFFLPFNILFNLICTLFAIIVTIYALNKRISGSGPSFEIGFLLVILGANFVLILINSYFNYNFSNAFVTASIVSVLCYIIFTHVCNLDYSLDLITTTTIQPVNSILKFNNIVILIFVLILALGAIFSDHMQIDTMIIFAGHSLLAAIRFLFGLMGSDEEFTEEPIQQEIPQGGGGMMLPEGEYKTSIILLFLEKVFTFLTYAAIIGLVVFGVVYGIYKLYHKFNTTKPEEMDQKEFIKPDIAFSNIRLFNIKLSDFFPSFGNSLNQKVRKLFYKKIKKYLNKGLSIENETTAKQMAERLKPFENIAKLEEIYEQARYGETEISKEQYDAVLK